MCPYLGSHFVSELGQVFLFPQTSASWGWREGREQKASSDHNMLTSGALGEEVSTLESSMGTGIISWEFEHFCHGLPDTSTKAVCSSSMVPCQRISGFLLSEKKGISLLPGGEDFTFLPALATTLVLGVFFPQHSLLASCSYFKTSSQKLSSYTGMLINMS